jgi:hypothetical protein
VATGPAKPLASTRPSDAGTTMEPTIGGAMRLLERMRGKKHEPIPSAPVVGPPIRAGAGLDAAEADTFLMAVDDVFSITGRGTVVTGRIARGVVRPGDRVELVGDHDRRIPAVVAGVESFRKLLEVARAGDNVGVLLGDVDRAAVEAGMLLVAAGSSALPPVDVVTVAEAELVVPPAAGDEAPPEPQLEAQVETGYARYPGSGVCDVCNRDIGPGEAFQVPTAEFWASSKYQAWITTNPVTRGMLMMSGVTVDDYIAMQRGRDTTAYSAVCPDCIHLFP